MDGTDLELRADCLVRIVRCGCLVMPVVMMPVVMVPPMMMVPAVMSPDVVMVVPVVMDTDAGLN